MTKERKIYTRSKMTQAVLIMLSAAVLIIWFYPHQRDNKLFYEQGQPWNYAQLIAPFDIPIHPDSATVEQIKDTIRARFVPIYTYDGAVIDSIIRELPPQSMLRSRMGELLSAAYEGGVISSETWSKVESGELGRIRVLEGNVLSERSTVGLLTPHSLYLKMDSVIKDPLLRHYFTSANLHHLLRPNLLYDEDVNRRHLENEYQTLTADRGVIIQGQAIINKGDIITAQDYTNLKTYEQMLSLRAEKDSRSELLNWVGQAMYVLILLGLLLGYLILFEPQIFGRFRAVFFTYLLVTVFFLLTVGMVAFLPSGAYIVPIAIVPILIMAFFNGRSALFTAIVTVLICAPVTAFALEYIFLSVCASAAAVFALRELTRRSQLLRTALAVALSYIVSYLALELLLNGTMEGFTWRMPIYLAANGLLTSMVYILMFAIERGFGFVSVVTLVELADTNNPLLRELSDVCPGTLQHSMSVSNLAGEAARAMGANEQLVRAGALYHDIGKMTNPAFFTENQHGVNPHDALSPEQSAQIVIDHVTDGLKRASKAGLPAVIKDFIREHHGKGKAKYFYIQYCKNLPEGSEPDEEKFTYPGPNPRTRETSLLMMADAVEAASRSLSDYSRAAIGALVNKIIDGQIAEGLHNTSNLQFKDIAIIKEAFVKRLMTIYHTRIAYPEAGKGVSNKG